MLCLVNGYNFPMKIHPHKMVFSTKSNVCNKLKSLSTYLAFSSRPFCVYNKYNLYSGCVPYKFLVPFNSPMWVKLMMNSRDFEGNIY